MTYAFDEGDFGDTTLQQNISPVQHDYANFGSSLVAGRANLTSTTRWNVEYPSDAGQAVSSSLKYNTAGSVVAKVTPWDGTNTRTVKIGYADNWNSGGTPTTFAYPTSILSVTDGRGAVTNLTYNSRGLLTQKGWTVPTGSGTSDPAGVGLGIA